MHAFDTLLSDTIVAQVTARGPAGLAVVRISGPDAARIFSLLAPNVVGQPSHRMHRIRLLDASGALIDDAMAVSMHAPRSYTGEDVVELFLHGADIIAQSAIDAAVTHGARLARPGEFTRRAYTYGRLSLAQAEAVGALTRAADAHEQQSALKELDEGVGAFASAMLEKLEPVLAGYFAVLDFPEHPTEAGVTHNATPCLAEVLLEIQNRLRRARRQQTAAPEVVLAGASNVGKSTLFNALLGEERALVDAIPGTTRDRVSATYPTESGVVLSLSDTAGLRAEASGVEARGIHQGQAAAKQAAVVLWVVDAKDPVWPSDIFAQEVWLLGGRADLFDDDARQRFVATADARGFPLKMWISGQSGEGLSALVDAINAHVVQPLAMGPSQEDHWLAQDRHIALLKQSAEALTQCLAHLETHRPLDLVATELREATAALGQILGRDVDARVLDQIFAQFCIGK